MNPLLTIVIANYNYGRFLDEAIQSVLSQSCLDFELIVVDGGSTDNSVEVIKRYQNQIAWWCSEPDKGQSDAFNKGFSHATGRFLTWLNADDVMLPGTIAKLKVASERYPEQEWFVGGCFWLDPEMRIFRCGRARHMSRIRAEHGLVNVCGPSSFFAKDLYLRAGKIDERNHYTMDTDLWLRFALNEKVAYRPFIRYAWGLRLHPAAKMSGHKFTADGRILSGEASDAAFVRDQKRMQQLQQEHRLTLSKIPPLKGTMSRWMQVATADWIPALMSRWDTFRYGGKKLSLVIHNWR